MLYAWPDYPCIGPPGEVGEIGEEGIQGRPGITVIMYKIILLLFTHMHIQGELGYPGEHGLRGQPVRDYLTCIIFDMQYIL